MRGLRINFDKTGASIDFTQSVSGFRASIQNALVNMGQDKGLSKIYADKGTDLLKAGVRGAMVSSDMAGHFSNFAALDTLFFSREHTPDVEDDDVISNITLEPVEFDGKQLHVQAVFESNDGRIIGTTAEI